MAGAGAGPVGLFDHRAGQRHQRPGAACGGDSSHELSSRHPIDWVLTHQRVLPHTLRFRVDLRRRFTTTRIRCVVRRFLALFAKSGAWFSKRPSLPGIPGTHWPRLSGLSRRWIDRRCCAAGLSIRLVKRQKAFSADFADCAPIKSPEHRRIGAHRGLVAATNCSARCVCCSMSTRPAEENSSTKLCRSNMVSPIRLAVAVSALRTGAACPE